MTPQLINIAIERSPTRAYRAPIRERLRVWWQNWKVRHVGKAVRTLSKAMKDDPDFRQVWHANIAMPIRDELVRERLHPNVAMVLANHSADRLMKHLFDA